MSVSSAWDLSGDAELITAVRAGEAAAFGVLYERHAAAARAVARQYAHSEADAEDAVADAFSRVLSTVQAGGGPDVAFRAYLFTVLRRVALQRIESGRRAVPTDDLGALEAAAGPTESTESPTMAGFERGVVSEAYRSLPERWQAVLWYTEVEELSPAQIAPVLGLTANGVAALAYRAREGLRQAYLQQHLGTPTGDACLPVNTKLGAYVRGGLARRETASVEAHLQECGTCRALVLELGDVNHGMRAVIAPLVLGAVAITTIQGIGFGGAAGTVAAAAAAVAGTGAAAGAGGTAAGTGATALTGTGVGTGAGATALTGTGVGTGATALTGTGAAAGTTALTGAGAGATAVTGAGTGAAALTGTGATALTGAGLGAGTGATALTGAAAAGAGATAVTGAGIGAGAGAAAAAAGASTGALAAVSGGALVGAGVGGAAAATGAVAAVAGAPVAAVGVGAASVVVAAAVGFSAVFGTAGPSEPTTVAAPTASQSPVEPGVTAAAPTPAPDGAAPGTGAEAGTTAPAPAPAPVPGPADQPAVVPPLEVPAELPGTATGSTGDGTEQTPAVGTPLERVPGEIALGVTESDVARGDGTPAAGSSRDGSQQEAPVDPPVEPAVPPVDHPVRPADPPVAPPPADPPAAPPVDGPPTEGSPQLPPAAPALLTLGPLPAQAWTEGVPGTLAVPVANIGGQAAADVRTEIRFPEGLTWTVEASADGWTCAPTGASVATCTGGTLDPAASTVLQASVVVDDDAIDRPRDIPVAVMASVPGGEPVVSGFTATVSPAPGALGASIVTAASTLVSGGASVAVGVPITNIGGTTVERVQAEVTVPQDVDVAVSGPWTCEDAGSQTLRCSADEALAARGGSTTLGLELAAWSGLRDVLRADERVTVSLSAPGVEPVVVTGAVVVRSAPAAYAVEVLSTGQQGAPLTARVRVANVGGTTGTGVVVRVELPAGIETQDPAWTPCPPTAPWLQAVCRRLDVVALDEPSVLELGLPGVEGTEVADQAIRVTVTDADGTSAEATSPLPVEGRRD